MRLARGRAALSRGSRAVAKWDRLFWETARARVSSLSLVLSNNRPAALGGSQGAGQNHYRSRFGDGQKTARKIFGSPRPYSRHTRYHGVQNAMAVGFTADNARLIARAVAAEYTRCAHWTGASVTRYRRLGQASLPSRNNSYTTAPCETACDKVSCDSDNSYTFTGLRFLIDSVCFWQSTTASRAS